MRIINILLLTLFLLVVNGCASYNEKCVQIFDENNNLIEKISLKFTVLKTRNNEASGGLVTTLPPLHEINLVVRKRNDFFCFENNPYGDNDFLYNHMSIWKFYNDQYELNFYSFDSIPSKIVLKKVDNNSSKNLDFKIKFLDINISKSYE